MFSRKFFQAITTIGMIGAMLGAFLAPVPMLAEDVSSDIGAQLNATAGKSGAALGQPIDPRATVILIIRVILGMVGIALICLNVYAGFLWMTAGGNEEKVTEAKTLIRNGVIGLVIILSAYSITLFVANLARGVNRVNVY